jgi:AraC-like DNA-binding protein
VVGYKKYLDLEIFEGEISSHEYPWHFHNGYTFILVEKGSICYEFQDKSIVVKADELFIIEPLKVHRNIINEHTVYKAIFIPQEYFKGFEKNKVVILKVNDSKLIHGIYCLFNQIKLKYRSKQLEETISEICNFIRDIRYEQDLVSHTSRSIVPQVNYHSTLDELAEAAHVSKFHFQRKFKKDYGLTIGQLKLQEKTTKAKDLLQNGRLSTDVAYELGFFDQSHFIKYFKKMWAITPKKFK